MPAFIEGVRKQAQAEFLGRGPVVGVGIGAAPDEELIFLLRDDSVQVRREVLKWAREYDVRVQFLVTGRIRALIHKLFRIGGDRESK